MIAHAYLKKIVISFRDEQNITNSNFKRFFKLSQQSFRQDRRIALEASLGPVNFRSPVDKVSERSEIFLHFPKMCAKFAQLSFVSDIFSTSIFAHFLIKFCSNMAGSQKQLSNLHSVNKIGSMQKDKCVLKSSITIPVFQQFSNRSNLIQW